MEEKQVFLIQSSGKPADHQTVRFKDRTYADEVSRHYYYRNEAWDIKKRDLEFGNVKPGDYVLHYCTSDVESNPSRIKNTYQVVGLENAEKDISEALKKGTINKDEAKRLRRYPHVIRLKPHIALKRGLEVSLIRRWVDEGKLSGKMINCGRVGFNICRVEMIDYEAILEWDKDQIVEFSASVGSREEDLRRYIAGQNSLGVLGRAFNSYKLYSDDAGRIGEEYDTGAVGRIDLLFQSEKSGDLVVVELKRTEDTSDKAIGQIARYMGWVEENLAKGKKVRGVLVVRGASEELRYAAKAIRNCQLATYEPVFQFKVTG